MGWILILYLFTVMQSEEVVQALILYLFTILLGRPKSLWYNSYQAS